MNRREFGRLLAAGAAVSGAGIAGAGDDPHRSARQNSARARFSGFENSIRPSYTPDFSELDEVGIRHDVRQSIAHGVFSVFCAPGNLNPEETARYFAIVADEAADRVMTSTIVVGADEAAQLRCLRLAEAAGLSHVLIHPYPGFRPASREELYAYYRRLIDATDLDVVLWATGGSQMTALHPSNVVVDVLDRLADLDNVVALKLMATLEATVVFECLERLGNRLLVNCVDLAMMPLLVAQYGVQWSGAWTIEALQSPQRPYVVDYLELLTSGAYTDALALYWKIKPAYDELMAMMAPMLPRGIHPSVHLKYYQWCVGGNGGLPRAPLNPAEREFPLMPAQRTAIQAAYRVIGIEPQGPEESFVTGRAAWARGVRPADLDSTPMYVA